MRLIALSSLFLYAMCGYSQEKDVLIQVGVEKRIYLLFEANVHKVDWAETDSVAIKYEENKVIIQSRADDLSDSNLLVETEDGYNYSFILKSTFNLAKVTYVITQSMAFYKSGRFQKKRDSENSKGVSGSLELNDSEFTVGDEIAVITKKIENAPTEATGLAIQEKRMTLFVGGIYIHQGNLFFKVLLQNESNVAYDIDLISFTIEQAAGNLKKTAVEKPKFKTAKYVLNGEKKQIVKGNISNFVFVFDKFTFDKKEILYCEVWELGGKRKIRLPIPLNKVLNAKSI